jgi:hypothetical protein
MEITFEKLVDEVYKLDSEGKEHLKELLEKSLIEERRDEILQNAIESKKEYESGKMKFDTADNILKKLNEN